MTSKLTGEIPIKIEFDDDEFKLSSFEFLSNGKFRAQSGLTLKQPKFRALAVTQKSNLVELVCDIEGCDDGRPFGRYTLVNETKI